MISHMNNDLQRCKVGTFLLASILLVGCTQEPTKTEAPSPTTATTPAAKESDAARGATLSVGVVPQQAASVLAKQWTPLLNHIGEKAGVRLVFKTAKDIPAFERCCANGEYDIAYMNPYHYTVYHETPGYEAIAKRSGSKIKGILVKKRGSPLKALQDLAGADLAFPAPRAFAATLLTTAGLDAAEVSFQSHYVSSHDSVYLNVAKGRFAAGGGIMRTLKSVDQDVRDQLEILWQTPEYTPHAFAVHPRVDAKSRGAVADAMVALGSYEEGRELLNPLRIKLLEAASNQDWDDVRALNIEIR